MKISVIISTYNRPQALKPVLESYLHQQHVHDQDWEIIIADDGSSSSTQELIKVFQARAPIAIQHIWQEDHGFQLAKIRNKAAAAARGTYLVFTDGDCMVPPHFVARHLRLAEPNYIVTGSRILLSPKYTEYIEGNSDISLSQKSPLALIYHRLQGHINRFYTTFYLPYPRRLTVNNRWQGAKGCNLALWRQDLIAINGFDEAFCGWGFEDSDLIIRLFQHGVKRKDGRFASYVFHLWHQENARQHQERNWSYLQARIAQKGPEVRQGIQQYL